MLRQAVERTGGRQVKTLGDGVLAVFGAADTVACAVAMQQAVDGQARLDGIPLSIRIGLALGDLSFEEDDVFGTRSCRRPGWWRRSTPARSWSPT